MTEEKNIQVSFENSEIGSLYLDILDWLEERGKPRNHNVAMWAAWLAFPQKSFRQKAGLPTTLKGLAQHLGITEQTLQNYRKNKSELAQYAKQKIATALFSQDLNEIVQATIDSAKIKGREGLGDRKVVYQMLGMMPSGKGNTAVAVAGAGTSSSSASSATSEKTENVVVYLPDNQRQIEEGN